jgi:hypothetical protein
MKKLLAALWLGIWLYFGTFLALSPTFAAGNMAQTTDKVEASANGNLSTVQQFLVSIPRDYYTVRQINKLKALGKEQQALFIGGCSRTKGICSRSYKRSN